MDLAELERKLIAAARVNPPDETVPIAFEKRVMARIAEVHGPSYASLWAQGLWRGALASMTAAGVVCGAVLLFGLRSDRAEEFADQFESTMLAAVELEPEADL